MSCDGEVTPCGKPRYDPLSGGDRSYGGRRQELRQVIALDFRRRTTRLGGPDSKRSGKFTTSVSLMNSDEVTFAQLKAMVRVGEDRAPLSKGG